MEDWLIRRLREAEGMPVKVITQVMGISGNPVRAAVISYSLRSTRGCGRGESWRQPSRGSRAAAGVSGDAGAGDRAVHRM